MSELADELLAKPTGPVVKAIESGREFTRQIDVREHTAEVVINSPEEVDMGEGVRVLEQHGLDPANWAVTGFKVSEWTMQNGERGLSTRFTFGRKSLTPFVERPPLDEIIDSVEAWQTFPSARGTGEHGFIVALGDMQWGKIDGDGVEGTLRRTIEGLNKALSLLWEYSNRFDIGHVHIAWLGDHVEGFNSQGGANVWRTGLTLSEQIRLTRRVMLHALLNFADTAETVSMAAVPGNHGDTVRIAGKGVTRYDDSHDTESLIAVADAAAIAPEKFGHVQFLVPHTDEMTVVTEVAGTVVAHAHGHQWKYGKHFDWWKGQAFNAESPMGRADLLLAGHLHHEHIDSDGKRLFIQVPSMESESTWFRHSKGTTGNPGLIVAVTKDGNTSPLEFVR